MERNEFGTDGAGHTCSVEVYDFYDRPVSVRGVYWGMGNRLIVALAPPQQEGIDAS